MSEAAEHRPTEEYLSALEVNLDYARHHYNAALTLLRRRRGSSDRDATIGIGAEFTAMMSALHRCLDVLAVCISGNPQKTFRQLNPEEIQDEALRHGIESLRRSAEYLVDLVNVSKHRDVIRVSEEWAFLSACQPIEYLVVEGFERGPRSYGSMGLEPVMERSYENVSAQVRGVIEYLGRRKY